jgi:hypothetical protein
MPHSLKNGCATVPEVRTAGAHAQEWAGGRLGRSDAHDDGRISRDYLRRLYPRKSTLKSRGIKYQYAEIALINMELV